MLKYVVPLIFMLSSANSWRDWAPKNQLLRSHEQVASEAQVKFALENKYDDTGPGAKQPENAYRTYKNLEDALVAYLDDPDTKLPEHEREKAINKLTQSQKYFSYNQNPFQQERFKPQLQHQNIHTNIFSNPIGKLSFTQGNKVGQLKVLEGNEVFKSYQAEKKEPFKLQRIQLVKGSPLSVAHYTKDPDLQLAHDQFEYPKYSFSYGVHDKLTGDSKSAQESRDGGSVRGFYSFRDADGKTRTVHYTADDQLGFRAEVQKT
ncbi:hypothetical protein PYW07_016807 [Mythimna separata]|uniref:Uncharacterized protein n=1 Tax=Mythimna separata TaxID=271217 RepID=A0AAD8DRX2_MYTSE|nr:hypothetical protein PYW07_016807 [Mythimna separata]